MSEDRIRLLLVEDNTDYVMLIRDTLEGREEGYAIQAASSPEEALELMDREEFDLVLLDYKFPRGNGLELIRRIKGKASFIPTVMITAFGNEDVAIQAMRDGALDFIPKSRDFLQVLPEVIHRVLDRSRIIQERIRTREALERRNRELQILNDLSAILAKSLDAEVILEETLAKVLTLTELPAGCVALAGEGREGFRVVTSRGVPPSVRWEGSPAMTAAALEGGKATATRGPAPFPLPGLPPGESEAWHLTIPLRSKERILGVVRLFGPPGRRGKSRELDLLTSIGSQIGIALENAILYHELKETKGRLEDLVENAGDEVLTVDPSGRVLTWNRGAVEIYGWTAEEAVGRDWEFLIPEDKRAETRRLMDWVLQGNTVRSHQTIRMRRDGHPLEVAVTLSPLKNQAGKVTGISSLAKDLTRIRVLQQQLIQSEKMAAVGQLISGVAHELNNPLTAVIGYSQLVSHADCGEKRTTYLDRIGTEALRCQRIVQNLLTFARKHKPEKKVLDVNEALRSTIELRAYDLKVNNIELLLELAPDLPCTMADYHQLQQVFVNILNNAQQAMSGQGGGRLAVRSSSWRAQGEDGRETDRRWIRVEFLDTGPGVPDEHLKNIFDPFFTTKEVGQGTGLGLSLSYGIVQEHAGSIYARRTDGWGAHFVIELPVVSSLEVQPAEDVEPAEPPVPPRRRILVVDDEPTIREMVSDILELEGHTIDLAADGRDALDQIGRNRYDMIIADLKMPEFDGAALYRAVQERDPGLARRILFSTGDTMSPDTRSFLERAGNPYISKPFGVNEIKSKVNEFLGAIE